MTLRNVVLITGASSGIGADLAHVFALNGHDLALVARSTEKLIKLSDELDKRCRHRPIVITCDLAERDAIEVIAGALAAENARVSFLINNAGWGLLGEVMSLDPQEQLNIIDVNARALVGVTLRFLPDLVSTKGKILNVASIASFMAGPNMAVYYATKAFVSSFSRALNEELKSCGVDVTVLHPGLTQTEFQGRAGFDKVPGLNAMKRAPSRAVAEAGYAGLIAGRRSVVHGLGNKISTAILPLLPDSFLLPIVRRAHSR